MATVSHLPHVLANVLVARAARLLSEEGERLPATGPSFRDATRVAGANTDIWRDIYLANADALVAAIDDTVRRLTEVRGALLAGDGAAVSAWNDGAREERRRLLEVDLAGGEVHELRVAVPNRPGVVAEVALALGRAGVNILDMALYPAPDHSSGTIALWVAGERHAAEAQSLVKGLGLTVARP
jgi:prephenate dehydrogenase